MVADGHGIASDVFVLPEEAHLILYAPLLGVAALINRTAAALLRNVALGRRGPPTRRDREVLDTFVGAGIVDGGPGLRLAVHEALPFRPTCVTLFLTNACNLRCVYCYANGGGDARIRVIPRAAAEAGIRLVADNAVRTGQPVFAVNFHGGGEPTVAWALYRHLVAYARTVAQDRGLRATITTCTNGVLSRPRALWMAANTDYASVSLDGQREVQDVLRPWADGRGSFDAVRRTLGVFDECRFGYMVRGTVCRDNVRSLPTFVQWLCEECDPDSLQFEPMMVDGRCGLTGCAAPETGDFVAAFAAASRVAAARGRTIGFSTLSLQELRTFYCCAEADGFALTHDGLITACFGVFAEAHPQAETFIYGRFDAQNGDFTLDEERLERLRRRHTGREGRLPRCDKCFCKYMCAGDCALNSLRTGCALATGSRCALTRAIAANLLRDVLHLPAVTDTMALATGAAADIDDTLAAIVPVADSPGFGTPPAVLELRRFEVREVSYMRAPPPEQAKARSIAKAVLQARRGRPARALGLYDGVLRQDPDCVTVLVNSAALLIGLGRAEEALARARHAVALEPRSVTARIGLGRALAATGRCADARAAFEAATALDPLSPIARFNLAWLHAAAGRPADALPILDALAASDGPLAASAGRLARLCREGASGASLDDIEDGWRRELVRMMRSNVVTGLDAQSVTRLLSISELVAGGQYTDVLAVLGESELETAAPPLFHWLSGLALTRLRRRAAADASLAKAAAFMPRIRMQPGPTEWRLLADGWTCPVDGGTAIVLAPGTHRLAVESAGEGAGCVRTDYDVEIAYGVWYSMSLSGLTAGTVQGTAPDKG